MDKLYYFPKQLAEELKRIDKIFDCHNRLIIEPDGELDDLLKQLIYCLIALKPSQISRFGRERSEDEISALSRYVCSNSLNVKCDNIYSLLNEYASSHDWETIFGDWQNYLNNKDALNFLEKGVKENSRFQEYLSSKGVEKTKLFWFNQEDKVSTICSKCKDADTIDDYKKALTKMGLIDETLLFKTCMAKFFLACTAKAYKSVKEIVIYDAFIKLKADEAVDLAVNFVKVFDLNELNQYRKMFEAFEILEANNKDVFMDRLQSANLKDKYNRWCKQMIIIKVFKDNSDPFRTVFWLKYEGNAINTELLWFQNDADKVLVMTFDNYVITEFGDKAAGKAYVFPKEVFDKYRRKIRVQTKAGFINDVNYDALVFGMEHKPAYGKWQAPFRYRLKHSYGIIPSEN